MSKKRVNRSKSGNITILIFLLLFAAISSFPLVYAIVQSLKPLEELFLFPPRFFVRNPTMQNFSDLFNLANSMWVPITRYFANSIWISVFTTVGHVVISSMCAYPLAKHNMPGKNVIFSIIMISLLFSNSRVTHVPMYVVISEIGLLNSQFAIILPGIAASLGLYLMKQFMQGVPDSMLEAARIDGSSEFNTFWKIVMPNVKPGWLTLTVFSFQHSWNNNGGAFIFDENLKPLPVAFHQIASAGIARSGVGAATAIIMLIPPVITFVLTQSNIIETMATSGMKD